MVTGLKLNDLLFSFGAAQATATRLDSVAEKLAVRPTAKPHAHEQIFFDKFFMTNICQKIFVKCEMDKLSSVLIK